MEPPLRAAGEDASRARLRANSCTPWPSSSCRVPAFPDFGELSGRLSRTHRLAGRAGLRTDRRRGLLRPPGRAGAFRRAPSSGRRANSTISRNRTSSTTSSATCRCSPLPEFADFLEAYGKGGRRALERGQLRNLARLYWYTVEFGLIQTASGTAHLRRRHHVLARRNDCSRSKTHLPTGSGSTSSASCAPNTSSTISSRPTSSSTASSSCFADCYQDFGPLYDRVRSAPDIEAHELTESDQVLTRGDFRYFRDKGKTPGGLQINRS